MTTAELRAQGSLQIVIGSLDAGMRPIGPIALSEAGIIADVRPVVLPIDDGFVVFAVRGDNGPRLAAWYINALNNIGPELGADLPGPGTSLGGAIGDGIGRVVVQAGLSTFIQDFAPTLGRPGLLASRILRPRLPAADVDILAAGQAWALTWLDTGTQRPMFGPLDEALGDFVAGPADLLPGLRDGVNHLHVHFTPDSALGRIGVSTGIRGRVGPLGCR
ncbi:MAG: hypothetical protein R3F60_19235 [bacterium]